MSTGSRSKSKVRNQNKDGMFSRENMQAAFSETTESKSRDSKRLKEAGVPKRPINPNYSSSLKPSTSGQVPPQRERYGDPTEKTSDREAGGNNAHSELDSQNMTDAEINNTMNAELHQAHDNKEREQLQAAMDIPGDHFEQHKEFDLTQEPSYDMSIEELERLNREWEDNAHKAELIKNILRNQEKSRERESFNSSTKANRDISTQDRQTSRLVPTNQAPQVSRPPDPSVSQLPSRPPLNYRRPSVEQGESSVRENFEQHVRSPIYNCQPHPEDNRDNADIYGGTPHTATSQYLHEKKNDLVSQIGNIKRNTEHLSIRLQHFEKIAYDYGVHSDRDLFNWLESIVDWGERATYYNKHVEQERNYRTLREFLLSGQPPVSDILLARGAKPSMSSRELGDEISHWLAEFRKEGVLKKFVTIHLAPNHLKSHLRRKLNLNDEQFQDAWRVMLDADEQEAKAGARNINYNVSRPDRNKPGGAQWQQGANNNQIVCYNHRKYGKKCFDCLDNNCIMKNQTVSRPRAKNEHPDSPQ